MPKRHGKISIAIIIIVTLWLPLLSIASFKEKGEAVGDSIGSLGTFVGLFLSGIGSTLDQSINALTDVAKRQHQMLRRNLRERISGIHRMLGATKQSALALVSSLRPSHNPSQSPLVKGRKSEISPPYQGGVLRGSEDQQTLAQAKDEDGKSQPTFIERVIERVTTVKEVLTPTIVSSDSRVNKLITDVADLTSRVDEKDGPSTPVGVNSSSLFNMIAQSQRIKTLDDVKITNATIEGYVQSSSLSNYLPLTGGTLTGGLIGTSL